MEIETNGSNAPIGINFKPSAVPLATQINLENALYGQSTGINMGNQLLRFGVDIVTGKQIGRAHV